ncbi:MAG: hypothetical protein OEM52_07680 [bacterium]|nr:hypothetical protein [bacterium]
MKYVVSRMTLLLAVGVMMIIGCTKSSTGPDEQAATYQQEVIELTQNEEADYFSFDDLIEDDTFDGGGMGLDDVDTAIVPLRWGRFARTTSYTREAIADSLTPDTVRVTVTRTVTGVFRIITSTDTIDKPFTDVYRRNGVFHRVAHTRHRHLNWRLVRISAIEGQTQNNSAVDIATVTWYRKGTNETDWTQIGQVTDPLAYWHLRDVLPVYYPGDSLKVEVAMPVGTEYYGQLHYRPWRSHDRHRTPFVAASSNVFTATGTIPSGIRGSEKRQIFVDFMTNGTLFDDAEPYAANAWGLLYRVSQ